jgi:hypothetical protein
LQRLFTEELESVLVVGHTIDQEVQVVQTLRDQKLGMPVLPIPPFAKLPRSIGNTSAQRQMVDSLLVTRWLDFFRRIARGLA